MKQKVKEKLAAVALRKKGYSVNEITNKIGVAKSSVSVWVRNVELSKNAKKRLATRITRGQLVFIENRRIRREALFAMYSQQARREVSQQVFDNKTKRLICALLYWCEGAKDSMSGVYFMNSDPQLTSMFLSLLRGGFDVDEKKFRISLHLHEYHNEKEQVAFWSKETGIPTSQFFKIYQKPHTKKRIREGYPGCASVRYYSVDLSRQLHALAKAFLTEGRLVQ